jgi:hypothetical protein
MMLKYHGEMAARTTLSVSPSANLVRIPSPGLRVAAEVTIFPSGPSVIENPR